MGSQRVRYDLATEQQLWKLEVEMILQLGEEGAMK